MNDNLQLVSDYLKNYFTNAINSHLSQFLDSTSHDYQKPNPHAHFVPHAFVLYLSDGKVTTSLYTPAIEHKDKHTIIKIMFNPDMREEFYTLPNLAIQTNRQVIDINYLLTIYHYISSIQLSLPRFSESLHTGHEETQEKLEMLINEDMYPPFLHRIFQRVGIPVTRDESEDAWVFPVRDIVSETALAEVRTFILNTYGEEELILFNELLSLGTDIQTTH